ncbi:coiled-coil domain-containing protein 117 [Arapaima gigas]
MQLLFTQGTGQEVTAEKLWYSCRSFLELGCPSFGLCAEMHRPGPVSSELGFLPSLYPIPGVSHAMDIGMSKGSAQSVPLTEASVQNPAWERRYLRKHKRRLDDEGCDAKRRRMMGEGLYMPWGDPRSNLAQATPQSSSPMSQPLYPGPLSAPACPVPAASCMEMEAAQRQLQEIEDRITLEDDEEEDLDVELVQNRPVLVISDSLKEGLQQGLGDILPQAVAQSVSRSCMELVLWRPPEVALPQKLKDTLERQRKQSTSRLPLAPAPTLASNIGEREPHAAEEEMEL